MSQAPAGSIVYTVWSDPPGTGHHEGAAAHLILGQTTRFNPDSKPRSCQERIHFVECVRGPFMG